MPSSDQVKALRDKTGVSVMQCKRALERAEGDEEKALEFLREEGARIAEKKADRELGAGVVSSYIHGEGDIGVLVKLCSETDFVSGNEEFRALAYDIAMHIAAMAPDTVEELLRQEFVKNPEKTIQDLLRDATQKFGENTQIETFVRLSVGSR